MTQSDVNINNLKRLFANYVENRQFARVVVGTIKSTNPLLIVVEENNMELTEELVTITWVDVLDPNYLEQKVYLIRQDKGGHYYALFRLPPGGFGYGENYGNFPSVPINPGIVGGDLTEEAEEDAKNRTITMIGDSLGVGTQPFLSQFEWKADNYNNMGSRQWSYSGDDSLDALVQLRNMADSDQLNDNVIMVLGTNRGVQQSEVDEAVGIIGDRNLILIDTKSQVGHAQQVTDTYRASASAHSNVYFGNWSGYAQSSWYDSDNIHMTGEGYQKHAEFITQVVYEVNNTDWNAQGGIGQPTAGKYDSSKSGGASAISTSGWSEAEVNQFNMNAADPPFVNGSYIDNFLRSYYPDSPLIGHGATIKKWSDYYGISVGAAMGVWAKETTFGRGEPGRSYNNFGCMMSISGYPSVYLVDRNWASFPSVSVGIAEWFRLARFNYVDKGYGNYASFLNRYSPPFENNQATFKNLMWGTLKAFGYDMSDTVTKRNYASNTPATQINLDTVGQIQGPSGQAGPKLEQMIKWFMDRVGKVTYSMSARTGPNSYDCSSAVFSAFKYAGIYDGGWLGTTETLFGMEGGLLRRISRADVRRGDIFVAGTPGASMYSAGHTGVILGYNEIIHCTYSRNGIVITPMDGWTGGPPVAYYRINV